MRTALFQRSSMFYTPSRAVQQRGSGCLSGRSDDDANMARRAHRQIRHRIAPPADVGTVTPGAVGAADHLGQIPLASLLDLVRQNSRRRVTNTPDQLGRQEDRAP